MMDFELQDVMVLVLFVIAIAIGWFLGRRDFKRSAPNLDHRASYFTGMNYLLNDEKDEAMDSLVSVLEGNTDSIDSHLVLAHMLRRRGETERAIQIHQNLLTIPELSSQEQSRINIELAQDYISVGPDHSHLKNGSPFSKN